MLDRISVGLDIPLHHALYLIAEAAEGVPYQNGEPLVAKALAEKLCERTGHCEKVPVTVPAVDLLCAMCDTFRQRGYDDVVAQIEEFIQVLKGNNNRLIHGALLQGLHDGVEMPEGSKVLALEHPDSGNKQVIATVGGA